MRLLVSNNAGTHSGLHSETQKPLACSPDSLRFSMIGPTSAALPLELAVAGTSDAEADADTGVDAAVDTAALPAPIEDAMLAAAIISLPALLPLSGAEGLLLLPSRHSWMMSLRLASCLYKPEKQRCKCIKREANWQVGVVFRLG